MGRRPVSIRGSGADPSDNTAFPRRALRPLVARSYNRQANSGDNPARLSGKPPSRIRPLSLSDSGMQQRYTKTC